MFCIVYTEREKEIQEPSGKLLSRLGVFRDSVKRFNSFFLDKVLFKPSNNNDTKEEKTIKVKKKQVSFFL